MLISSMSTSGEQNPLEHNKVCIEKNKIKGNQTHIPRGKEDKHMKRGRKQG